MATSYSLRLTFKSGGGNNLSMLFSYANPSATDADVNDLMDTIITNNDVFLEPPVSKVEAKLITREESEFTMTEPDGE